MTESTSIEYSENFTTHPMFVGKRMTFPFILLHHVLRTKNALWRFTKESSKQALAHKKGEKIIIHMFNGLSRRGLYVSMSFMLINAYRNE